MASSRLQLLLERFDAATHRWLSLDVFDTLLWRPFERPSDVFAEVHRGLAARSVVAGSAEDFVRRRVAAEAAARRGQPTGEVTLAEIASALSAELGGAPDAATLAAAELAAEHACLELDADVAALVRHAASRGVPYVLVSDMYLPEDELARIVAAASERAGVPLPPPAHVFVSGTRRAAKSGTLFDEVLATLGAGAGEVFHVGDHPRSDVESPGRRGIATFHYQREHAWLDAVIVEETRRLPTGLPHDAGLGTLRRKAVAAASDGSGTLRPADYGAGVLGPLLTLFADWVVADCVRHRQEVVYCLMREGHLLAPLIDRAARARSVRLDVRKLWASRYALRAASFHDASEAELRDYLTKRDEITLSAVARDLGVDAPLLRRVAGIDHVQALSANDRERVVAAFGASEALRAAMCDASAEKRARLFRYLDDAGVFASERLTLVDLGWAGTIQRTLAQAFRGRPRPSHVRGLYFATHGKLLELPAATCSADSFLVRLGEPADLWSILSRTPEILEQACLSPAGSLRGVANDGALEHFPQGLPIEQLRDIEEMQAGIALFAELWLPGAAARRARLTLADEEALSLRLRAILARSIERPTAEEVRLFAAWAHDTNDGSPGVELLLGDAELRRRARFMTYDEIRALSWLECYWPQGLARLVDKSPPQGTGLWQRVLANDALRAAASVVSRSRSALSRLVDGD